MISNSSYLATRLLTKSTYTIIQNSKRLKTHQVPQQLQIPPIPKDIFDEAVLMTLIRLQTGFQKLQKEQPPNSSSEIKSIQLKELKMLQIETPQGWFIFQGAQNISTFFYTSPFNGVFKYYYDLDTKQWKSNKDRHILQQNLAREIQGKFHAYLDI